MAPSDAAWIASIITGEFFHGWRRKLGCVTLLMAAVLTMSCLPSGFIRDQLIIGDRRLGYLVVISRTGHFSLAALMGSRPWGKTWESTSRETPVWAFGSNEAPDSGIAPSVGHIRMAGCSHGFSLPGSSFRCYRETSPNLWFIGCWLPYWTVIIPLTLLSAYIFLGKPRVAKRKIVGEN